MNNLTILTQNISPINKELLGIIHELSGYTYVDAQAAIYNYMITTGSMIIPDNEKNQWTADIYNSKYEADKKTYRNWAGQMVTDSPDPGRQQQLHNEASSDYVTAYNLAKTAYDRDLAAQRARAKETSELSLRVLAVNAANAKEAQAILDAQQKQEAAIKETAIAEQKATAARDAIAARDVAEPNTSSNTSSNTSEFDITKYIVPGIAVVTIGTIAFMFLRKK